MKKLVLLVFALNICGSRGALTREAGPAQAERQLGEAHSLGVFVQ